jgi:CDP-glucose 4,6-dehydratase
VLQIAQKKWNLISYEIIENVNNPHEANLLSLNISKAKKELGWLPIWTNEEAIEKTILWYKNYYENQVLNTELDLKSYINRIQH